MKQTYRMLAAACLGAALLAGCGGGGGGDGDDGSALDEVPASASASSKGLVDYLKALVGLADAGETSEPVSTDRFDPVTPDTTEPERL